MASKGRKKKAFTAHRSNDDTWYFYNSEEKIIGSCEVKSWHNDNAEYGQRFRTDFMVDLVVHERFGNYKEIESVGGLNVYLGKVDWNEDIRTELFVQHRENFMRDSLNQLHRKHRETNERVYKRHYNNYLQDNKNRLQAEIKKYDDLLIAFENQVSEYKHLNKILKNHRVYLYEILRYGKEQLSSAKGLDKMRKQEPYTISISSSYLAQLVNENKPNHTTASRVVNLFCLLGFFNKEFSIAEKHYKEIRKEDQHKMTYLSLNDDFSFENAEMMANQLYEKGYKIEKFTNEFVALNFGISVSEKIFSKLIKRDVVVENSEDVLEGIYFQQQANKLALDNPLLDLTYDEFYEDDFDVETPF